MKVSSKQLNRLLVKMKQTGFLHIFGASTLSKIVGFCSGIIIVRVVSQYDYGIYSYILNIVNIFMLFNGLGTLTGMLQYGSELSGKEERKKNAYFVFGTKIGALFNIGAAAVIVFYSLFFKLRFENIQSLFIAAAFIPIFTYLLDAISMYLRSGFQNREYSFLNSISTILIFGFILLGAVLFNIMGAILARYGALILSIFIGIYFLKKGSTGTGKTIYKLNIRQKIEFMKYCVVMSLTNAVARLLYTIDIYLIGVFISDASVIASYKTATIIPMGLSFIPTAVVTYIYPYFAQHSTDKKWIREKVKVLLFLLGVFNFLISAFLFFLAPQIIRIIFGSDYSHIVDCFRILVIGYFVSATFRIPIGNILDMIRKVKANFVISMITGALNIILDIILIYYWGAFGAAVATLIVYSLTSIFAFVFLIKWLSFE